MEHACICNGDAGAKLNTMFAQYQGQPDGLIQVLHGIQETYGYLPRELLTRVARELEVSSGEISGVITFYSLFTLKPKGKHQVSVCKGTACYVRGSTQVLGRLEKELKIKPGDTTDDGLFSVEVVRCLGACGLGPVLTVNDKVFARLKPEKLPGVLAKFTQVK
ncbi:MAG: NAD(P)H-dependent oxidoreductase subunit E [Bacillota bacterium]